VQPRSRRELTRSGLVERTVQVLTEPGLAHLVDLVAWPAGDAEDHGIVVANAAGRSRLTPGRPALVLAGRDPVAGQDPMAFLPYPREVADPSPPNERNAYPLAAERLAAFFSDPTRAPDVVVGHAPRRYLHGNLGEHGSLDVIQSRAPLLLSGPGVPAAGPRDDWARLVDVGPTLAHLAGVPEERLTDAAGEPLDGEVLHRLAAPGASWIVGLLWDGAHCGELLAMAGSGELPGVARLLERGTALLGGAVAEFPSVTLTNHTSLLTGVGPGRHGVLGNVFFDRATRQRVVPNDATTWHRSATWLRPPVRTVFEQVRDAVPGARTACIDEAIDRGADVSTMALVRAAGSDRGADALSDLLPDPAESRFLSSAAHLSDPYYRWTTQVDDAGVEQVLQAWADPAQAPRLTWWASTVTDAGHHGGGPRSAMARDSFRDSDRRLQAFLDHLDRLGVTDDVLFLLTADHGFEGTDPAVRGGWDDALRAAGVPFRDEGPGFLYLGEEHAP
jgi:hypothetical protein